MKVMENKFFKAIDFENVFDKYLNLCNKKIDCIISIKVDELNYDVEILGNLLNEITLCEVYNPEDGISIDIDHETILKWANVELDKYVERNKEAIMRTFPYQFEPQPTDGIRIL